MLFLENFKKGHQVSIPEITQQGSESTTQQNNSDEEVKTGDQRLYQAMSSTSPTGLDTLLQKVMDPNTQSEHLEKPKNLATSKRPKNKRKEKQSKSSEKPIYHLPKVDDISVEQNTGLPTDGEPELKLKR